jgi:nucleoside phosphorylase
MPSVRTNMRHQPVDERQQPHDFEALQCDILLFFTTSSEQEALKKAAKANGIRFAKRVHSKLGEYFEMGQVGDHDIIAIRTTMGPFSFQGSAAKGIFATIVTGATSIIQVGMAFGAKPETQNLGDVLISSSIIPYDRRSIRADDALGYVIDYSEAEPHVASESLLERFISEIENPIRRDFNIHVGAMLSGGARISSSKFRDDLIKQVPTGPEGAVGSDPESIIGGDMEGVGLLSISQNPAWIVVKGICDFAEDHREEAVKSSRTAACDNAVSFVLSTLQRRQEGA